MLKLFIAMLLSLFVMTASAFTLTTNRVEKIVDSIYLAEGGSKAKYRYGVQSIQTSNPRQACRESVINNFNRWNKQGTPHDFVRFIAKRYCPYNQQVWTKNVWFYWKKFDKEIK